MFAGKASRVLNIRLWAPGIAPADAKASVAPPAGLKQGAKLDLELYRPKAGETGGKIKDFDPDSNPEAFTIKIYWGSSETVKPDQPKIIKWAGLTPEQQLAFKDKAREAQASASSYFYKPDWTTGYWPTKAQPGRISDDAMLAGKYSLTTTFAGNVDIEAPSNVEFLAPISMSSPNLDNKIDLKKFMAFKWSEIANALGLHASIIGMEGKNTMIFWLSSEVFGEDLMGDQGFMQMADVKKKVSENKFMPGNSTSMTVPAGIFSECDFVMMQMSGYGPGSALEQGQSLPRIQTKTSLMIMLGGKKMRF